MPRAASSPSSEDEEESLTTESPEKQKETGEFSRFVFRNAVVGLPVSPSDTKQTSLVNSEYSREP